MYLLWRKQGFLLVLQLEIIIDPSPKELYHTTINIIWYLFYKTLLSKNDSII